MIHFSATIFFFFLHFDMKEPAQGIDIIYIIKYKILNNIKY